MLYVVDPKKTKGRCLGLRLIEFRILLPERFYRCALLPAPKSQDNRIIDLGKKTLGESREVEVFGRRPIKVRFIDTV